MPKICTERTCKLAAPCSVWEYLNAAGEDLVVWDQTFDIYIYIYTHIYIYAWLSAGTRCPDCVAQAQCRHLHAVGSVCVVCPGALADVSLSDVELLGMQSSSPFAAWLSVTAQLGFYNTATRAQFALLFSVKYNCEKEVVCDGRMPFCTPLSPAAVPAKEADTTIFQLPSSCCSATLLCLWHLNKKLQGCKIDQFVFLYLKGVLFCLTTMNSEEGEHGGQVEPLLASEKKEAGWKRALDAYGPVLL